MCGHRANDLQHKCIVNPINHINIHLISFAHSYFVILEHNRIKKKQHTHMEHGTKQIEKETDEKKTHITKNMVFNLLT